MKPSYNVGINPSNGGLVDFIGKLLTNWILPLFGAVALVGIIYAGVIFISSAGNPDKVKKARNALLYSIIAIVLVVFSIAIVKGLQSILKNEIL